ARTKRVAQFVEVVQAAALQSLTQEGDAGCNPRRRAQVCPAQLLVEALHDARVLEGQTACVGHVVGGHGCLRSVGNVTSRPRRRQTESYAGCTALIRKSTPAKKRHGMA